MTRRIGTFVDPFLAAIGIVPAQRTRMALCRSSTAHAVRMTRSREVVFLGIVAALVPLVTLAIAAGLPGFGNDFSSYWLAGRLVAEGTSPYDLDALSALAAREHVTFLLGTGYSYPPPFALLMVPLAWLPFRAALLVFEAVSVSVFAAAVAAWTHRLAMLDGFGSVGRAHRRAPSVALALAAGAYPPVIGSVYFGQVNLLVFGLLALGLWPLLASAGRTSGGERQARIDVLLGAATGIGGVIKLVPLVLAVPLVLWRRFTAAAALLASAGAALAAAALVAPAAARQAGRLSDLLGSDGFWTNQSMNGLATRLVAPTDRTTPLLPNVVDPAALGMILVAGLASLTLAILWFARPRRAPDRARGVARGVRTAGMPAAREHGAGVDVRLAVAFALVAGLAGAPKDSFWNHLPALLAVGLLLAEMASRARRFGIALPVRPLLAAWYAAAWIQLGLDATQGAVTRWLGGIGAVASSTALFGLLALWVLLAAALLGGSVGRQTLGDDALGPYSGS